MEKAEDLVVDVIVFFSAKKMNFVGDSSIVDKSIQFENAWLEVHREPVQHKLVHMHGTNETRLETKTLSETITKILKPKVQKIEVENASSALRGTRGDYDRDDGDEEPEEELPCLWMSKGTKISPLRNRENKCTMPPDMVVHTSLQDE